MSRSPRVRENSFRVLAVGSAGGVGVLFWPAGSRRWRVGEVGGWPRGFCGVERPVDGRETVR